MQFALFFLVRTVNPTLNKLNERRAPRSSPLYARCFSVSVSMFFHFNAYSNMSVCVVRNGYAFRATHFDLFAGLLIAQVVLRSFSFQFHMCADSIWLVILKTHSHVVSPVALSVIVFCSRIRVIFMHSRVCATSDFTITYLKQCKQRQ